jgi:hypothetical protein
MPLSPTTPGSSQPSGSATTINPANFSTVIDNPFSPLEPGTTFVSESPDGSFVDTVTVTRRTKVIDGVTVVVVQDDGVQDGVLTEKTFDYFAQDKAGNVWYFGEDSSELDNGKISHEGSWQAGVNGAQPGIIMEAHPHVGDVYMQENAPDVSQDTAQVLSLNASETTPYGSFDHLLKTAETTPLEPGALDHKVYAVGVGQLSEKDEVAGDFDRLVKIRVDGTGKSESLFGYAGGDEINGNAGGDSLDGRGGSDTMHGGTGNDLLDGGKDKTADSLYGDSGNDTIDVRTHDQAFGGSGNDTLKLFDNTGFGAIDGGSEISRNVAVNAGDVLQFGGHLDLTDPGVAGRITGIETLAMTNPQGGDQLKLSAHDVLDLGDGTFNPNHVGSLGPGHAARVDGHSGDQLTLTGGNWSHTDAHNAPAGYDVFGAHTPTGNAYVLVQEDVTVHLA